MAGVVAEKCPCGTGLDYAECCGRAHAGAAVGTAEALMRSRYSAFAKGDAEYVNRTWHPDTRPADLDLEPGQVWTGLEIVSTVGGGPLHAKGTVEFKAHFRHHGRTGVLHETSRFVRAGGKWVYLDGKIS